MTNEGRFVALVPAAGAERAVAIPRRFDEQSAVIVCVLTSAAFG